MYEHCDIDYTHRIAVVFRKTNFSKLRIRQPDNYHGTFFVRDHLRKERANEMV